MKYAYLSLTGQTRRFIKKLALNPEQTFEINDLTSAEVIDEPFVLLVPTYEREMVEAVFDFLDHPTNQKNLKGVAGSGNRNFAQLFVFTAKDITKEYDVPLIYAFEFSGTPEDVKNFKKAVSELES